ncbi:hypothetical protein TBR22_A14250 [Luteitalea sp. TBR-22]|uniref:hypothetical protein n=1 Tax=Luteitalea sp. TBR-22 TaxID=2802971 RepID=UPI001AF7B957|nr:hypothetical protein [Luteitalea sp. TBR-22]BCS32215.1 hypothetical protein TBR22_A14250 [Luteitalea sp. TBR-22]
MLRQTSLHAPAAVLAAVLTGVSPLTPLLHAQAPAPAAPKAPPAPTAQAAATSPTAPKPAAAAKAAPKAKAAAPSDGGWPRTYATASQATVTLYEPQVASWENQKHAVMHFAVGYATKDGATRALGTLRVEAETSVSIDERLVNFSDWKITRSNFPDLAPEKVQAVVAEVAAAVPHEDRVIALDRVLAYVDKSQVIPRNIEGVKADPPVVFHSTSVAVLVNLDGDPVWTPVKGTDLEFAVNTNWDLFRVKAASQFYLRHDLSWYVASDLKGPWKVVSKLPTSFSALPADDNWKDVREAMPPRPPASGRAPTVFVSTTPAELIVLQGEPRYLAVPGTGLLWVSNTESDVFRLGKAGAFYYLVAGRWFSAPSLDGPWTFATPTLPPDFGKIPESHDRSRVLASVPGTAQAAEAVLLAQVPQTARVSKTEIKAPEVQYQGEPKFEAVEKTTVARAVNTDKDIIKVGDRYYMCYEGVWFGADAPTGPWAVTGEVPKAIYEIPASSPSYNVTHVTVVEDDNDAVVFATAAAYTGLMVAWGCAVWGTGYYYPPYVWYGGGYPYYRPYYPTYGYSAWYNPYSGTYGRGAAVYGPYGGAGVGARYNPRTGTYARGAAAYGPYGARGVASAYNPRTGTYGATRQGSNVYGSWGRTGVQRGDQWATTSRYTNNMTGTTTRVGQGSGGGEFVSRNTPGPGGGAIARTGSGDVYAGRDGNVYRRDDGGWQKYDGSGNWSGVEGPTTAQREQAKTNAQNRAASGSGSSQVSQLNSDARARAQGANRTAQADAARARSGSYGAGTRSYGGSYGGARSMGGARGGGRRR